MSDGRNDIAAEERFNAATPKKRAAGVEWFALAILAVAAIGIAAVNLPLRVKLLGIFAIVVGWFAGWVLGFLLRQFCLHPNRLPTAVSTVLLLVLEIGIGLGTWYNQVSILDRQNEAHPVLQQLAAQKKKLTTLTADETPQESQERENALQSIEEFERKLKEDLHRERSFGRFLQRRLSAIRMFDAPWPAVIWGAEVFAGTFAGVWTFRRLTVISKGPTP